MNTLIRLVYRGFAHGLLLALGVILFAGQAFAQADFYKGKTIKIVRGGGPGGSGEFQTRALVKFLEKYIPGKPHIRLNSSRARREEKRPTSSIARPSPTD